MEIYLGYNVLNKVKSYLSQLDINSVYTIVDENVYRLHNKRIRDLVKDLDNIFYIMPSGESTKSFEHVLRVYDDLIEKKVDRSTIILSIGGGVIGDISGFIASTYKRGLKYIQIPTTLLAQVDSSIGGKVGINYNGYKNLIGSFYFPESTIIDISFLRTLDRRQITSGLGEILKYGLISDYELFRFISENMHGIYSKDNEVLLPIIEKAVSIKESIVSKDIMDRGNRKILNFGHTVGHAIESYYEFNKYSHGEAVMLGIMYESSIAKDMGIISEEYFREIYETLKRIIKPIKLKDNEIYILLKMMENDKKNLGNGITCILPIEKGKVGIFNGVKEDLIINSLKGEWIED